MRCDVVRAACTAAAALAPGAGPPARSPPATPARAPLRQLSAGCWRTRGTSVGVQLASHLPGLPPAVPSQTGLQATLSLSPTGKGRTTLVEIADVLGVGGRIVVRRLRQVLALPEIFRHGPAHILQ